MPESARLELRSETLVLTLTPSLGGSISALEFRSGERKTPVLRGCHEGEHFILNTANFSLIPFVIRIRGGRFSFRGGEVRLAPNLPGGPSPLHGRA